MFAYLSKRLVLNADSEIHSMSWNKNTDQLAVGGSNGLLRVLEINDVHNPETSEQERKQEKRE